jgi:hypothetical protein
MALKLSGVYYWSDKLKDRLGLMVAVRDGLPGPEVWLVIRRPRVRGDVSGNADTSFPMPPETQQSQLAWLPAARWPVELIYAELAIASFAWSSFRCIYS